MFSLKYVLEGTSFHHKTLRNPVRASSSRPVVLDAVCQRYAVAEESSGGAAN